MRRLCLLVVVALITVGPFGCRQAPPPASDDPADSESSAAPAEEAGRADPNGPAAEAAPPAADTESAGPLLAPANGDKVTNGSSSLLLGGDELVSGVPGSGPLQVAEVEAWLDNPANHEVLQVSLPLGLSQGQGTIKGLEENPLTRAKIELGRQLYFDKRLSSDATISCASCHDPDFGYAKDTRFGVGVGGQEGGRNSPVAYNRILSDKQFWDGRAADLEEQAVGPIANPIEMGNTHEQSVATLKTIPGYARQFERVFGDGVTIDNVGKAIASFERVIVTGPSQFDHYELVRAVEQQYPGDEIAELEADDPEQYAKYQTSLAAIAEMPEAAKRGRDLFFGETANCTACHVGANLTDEKYHNLGVGMDAENPDLGRYDVTKDDKDRGAFKTPTIRNVALTAPYMHDGSQQTLEEVVEWYDKGGHPNPQLSDKIKKLNLTPEQKSDLVAFMVACTGEFPNVERERLPE